jgi:hypothetical protein
LSRFVPGVRRSRGVQEGERRPLHYPDGYATQDHDDGHLRKASFVGGRVRDADHEAHGDTVLRFTAEQIANHRST